jgi:hypothetical protein
MLRRIQGVRFGRRTTWIVIGIAVALWAVVVLARIRDFVPEELRAPSGVATERPSPARP